MESAIISLPLDQDQMVWLIDFQGWNMSSISVSVTRETAHILQDHYPERLGLGILYNPPKIFESFWKVTLMVYSSLFYGRNFAIDSELLETAVLICIMQMVRPFIEPKTFQKVQFVYSDDLQSQQIMEDLFDVDKLESAFGGRNPNGFNYNEYSKVMVENERKREDLISSGVLSPTDLAFETESTQTDLSVSECEDYEVSDDIGSSFSEETALSHLKLKTPSDEKPNQPVDTTKDPALGKSKGAEEVRT